MSADVVARVTWPLERLGEALAALARHANLGRSGRQPPPPRAELASDRGALARWIVGACRWIGFEAERTQAPYRHVEEMLAGAAPALVRLSGGGPPRFIALAGAARRGAVLVIGPDHRARRIGIADLRGALCRDLEGEMTPELDTVLAAACAGARASVAQRTRAALLREQRGDAPIGDVFMLRLSPGSPLRGQLWQARLVRRIAAIAIGHAVQYGLWIASWWMLGRGALAGRLDPAWISAWALLVGASWAARLFTIREQGVFAFAAGALVRQRLLLGALSLPQDEARQQGTGQLLGRVLESEALETLGLTGGLISLEAVIELPIALVVLWAGSGGALHAGLLALWIAGTIALGVRYHGARTAWTDARLAMTNDLVEALLGHRTRLAQEPPGAWNQAADAALAHYLDLACAMDREGARYRALVARGWLVAGMMGIAVPFIGGTADPTALAIGLGGLMLAYRALAQLATGIVSLSGAGGDRILAGVTLEIEPGDRILLEGQSGGGKSTLAAVLSGLRKPEAGVLLLGGLDRATLGAETWRRRVAVAPQFQENYILTETFQFNLLMGCDWPPEQRTVREAKAICEELGLGPLLARMPAGALQMVGETGWQLSHGERSRLYIARALLQDPDLVILDENFGALDPENLERALRCVLARAPSVLIIAHP